MYVVHMVTYFGASRAVHVLVKIANIYMYMYMYVHNVYITCIFPHHVAIAETTSMPYASTYIHVHVHIHVFIHT